ncbi:spinster family MFS transporter [Steroidobacter flavus]|uniref:Spinster family MFS transporter n=1 Tax=Steroidobacter flavus TaxID=1842136 RepID=A0ABV8SZ71_9GAMM
MSTALPAASVEHAASSRRWYALAVLTAVYVFNIADRYVISTLIEPIKAELQLSDTAIGFLTGTALAIFYTGMGIPLGILADRIERRGLIALSIGIWSAMTAACGAAANFTQLLFARIGVGIGEAGGTPASQSMLADLFPFSQRVMATSIFALGAAAGSMLGSTGGGMIADEYGWRSAFYALAIPGIVMGLIVRFTLQEPVRGVLDKVEADDAPTLKQTLAFMRTQRSLVHVLAGGTVVTYWGWGLLWWTPAFLQRSHHLTTGAAGALTGTISGIAGAIGIVAGGLLIHYFAKRDPRWQVWTVGLATLFGTCASIGVYTTDSLSLASALLWLFVPVAYLNLAPILTLTQSLVLPRMRALSCAVLLFGANVANLALAPQIIGLMSDAFLAHSTAGAQSLRWALAVTTLTGFWAAYHFWAAGRDMRRDLERAGTAL